MEDHDKLVAEISSILALPLEQRLALAQRRRQQQVCRYVRQQSQPLQKQKCGVRKAGKGANVTFPHQTLLYDAARRNDIEEVRQLLKTCDDCSLNILNVDGLSILQQCASDGFEELVEMLVKEFKADVNIRDRDQWTPLHTAAICARANISQLLINGGADLLAMTVDGNMPYDVCEDEDTLDIIESEMANQDITQDSIDTLRGATERQMLNDIYGLFQAGQDPEFRGNHGESPLHVAACNGYITVIDFLLSQAQVSVDPIDEDGWQPIHCAAYWKQLPALELLVRSGADLNAVTNEQQTPADLIGDDTLREWMTSLLKDGENCNKISSSYAELPPIYNSYSRINASTHSVNGSMYNSNLSLADKSALVSSSRRLNSKEKEEKARLEIRNEALGSGVIFDEEQVDENLTANHSKTSGVERPLQLTPLHPDLPREEFNENITKRSSRNKSKSQQNETVFDENRNCKADSIKVRSSRNTKLNNNTSAGNNNTNNINVSQELQDHKPSKVLDPNLYRVKNREDTLPAHRSALMKSSSQGEAKILNHSEKLGDRTNVMNASIKQKGPKHKKFDLFHMDCCIVT